MHWTMDDWALVFQIATGTSVGLLAVCLFFWVIYHIYILWKKMGRFLFRS